MPIDTLILGGLTFDGFSTPADLPFGGHQQMHIHKLPGGSRAIDCIGPDDENRHWKGTLYGADALSQALTLDALRKAGTPVPYISGIEARTVIIGEFRASVERMNVIHYSLSLVTADGGDSGAPASTPDALVGSDLSAGQGVLSSNAASDVQ